MRRNRAVSTTLSYTLSLAIASILVSGLLIAGGNFVENRQEQVIRDELEVIGQQVASDIARVDRLVVAADNDPTVRLNHAFPARVSGSGYRVSIDPAADELTLESTSPEVSVTVSLKTRTDLGDSTAGGGVVTVFYDESNDRLEVQNG
ncbi:DUF7266 family protein [Haloarcula argentinensis]|uniref:Uncharacterized protein n=1 Tax=Haloarcula argentinensis TaxID=43776 RepID=A0A830FQ74_HALAR|nr:hypothetical protein [Haloarcula argentinensis]EMA18584.1 hypothetical protein C443_18839 [Haloarcula argentinensis DSM 12282]MDS0253858.1 hypothetical protein [Haloarcula argentinensis]GGM46172.1 hypothetical protein GCM10009006_29320 [Haloarcula argentinensis]